MTYWFDEGAANRAVEFIERYCRHTKGALAGQRLKLAEWQKERIVRPLFGWKREDGTRKYRTLYLEVGRGAGKTTLAAALAIYLLLADGELGAEIYSAANDRDQARLCFDTAKAMIEAEPALMKRAKVYKHSIVVPSTNSVYKVISADAGTKAGYNSHAIFYDEIAFAPSRDLYDVLHTSTSKRQEPIECFLTTAGIYEPESIGWELHQYAVNVRDGVIDDPSFLPVIYAADPEDDITEEATWLKANPNYPVSPTRDYMEAESRKALSLPSAYNAFVQFHLNTWVQQVTRWIRLEDWDACKGELGELDGLACHGGLDLSTTTDISAFVLVFPPSPGLPYRVLPHFWIPERKLRDNSDRVPYEAWERQGILTVTPGDVVDFDRIRADIVALGERYAIESIAFDPWNSTQLANQLGEQDGFLMVQHRQGFVSMNEPTKMLERLIVGRQIMHDGNPILRWMVNNVAIKTDPAGNIKPDKSKSRERIDGVVALIMGLSECMTPESRSVYEDRGLIVLG